MATLTSGYRYSTTIADKRKPSIDDRMYMLTPYNIAVKRLLEQYTKKPVNNETHVIKQDEYAKLMTAVNLAGGYDDDDTSIVIDEAIFAAHDLVAVDGTNEILWVTAGTGTTTITVTRGAAGTTAYPIPDNAVLRLIGNALSEAQQSPIATSTIQADVTAYLQDFETPFEITEKATDADNYTGPDLPHLKGKKVKEHGWKIEMALIYGAPYATTYNQVTNSDGVSLTASPRYFTGGMLYNLRVRGNSASYVTAPATLEMPWFIKNYLDPALSIGSDLKFLFCGRTIISAINYWKLGKMWLDPSDKALDMNITSWLIGGKTVKLVEHPFLNKAYTGESVLGAIGIMLDLGGGKDTDPQYLERYATRLDEMVITGVSVVDGKPKARKWRYYTECGLLLPDPNVHSALVGVFDYN